MIKEIIRLKSQGVSNKQIARAIKSSRTTVIKYLKLFEATGLSLEVLDGMPDEDLHNLTQIQDEPVVVTDTTRHAQLLDLFPAFEKQLSKVGLRESTYGKTIRTNILMDMATHSFVTIYNNGSSKARRICINSIRPETSSLLILQAKSYPI